VRSAALVSLGALRPSLAQTKTGFNYVCYIGGILLLYPVLSSAYRGQSLLFSGIHIWLFLFSRIAILFCIERLGILCALTPEWAALPGTSGHQGYKNRGCYVGLFLRELAGIILFSVIGLVFLQLIRGIAE
jgi:hypothetical protein